MVIRGIASPRALSSVDGDLTVFVVAAAVISVMSKFSNE